MGEKATERVRAPAVIELSASLAHEINNPLQSLTNTLYLARSGGDDAQAYLNKAEQGLQTLSELVRRLLSGERA